MKEIELNLSAPEQPSDGIKCKYCGGDIFDSVEFKMEVRLISDVPEITEPILFLRPLDDPPNHVLWICNKCHKKMTSP